MQDKYKSYIHNLHFPKIITKVILNVGLISTFIGIFYFVYVVTVEEEFVKKQLDILSVNLIDSIKPFLSENNKSIILDNLKKPNLDKEDEEILKHNNALTKSAIINISIIFIITMIIGYILCKHYEYNFFEIMRNNIILLFLIGMTEYTFLHMIPAKYITSDPSFVKYKLVSNLKRKINIVP